MTSATGNNDSAPQCDEFVVGLAPFTSPNLAANLSAKLRVMVGRYRATMMDNQAIKSLWLSHHVDERMVGAFDFLVRDFAQLPEDVDRLAADIVARRAEIAKVKEALALEIGTLEGFLELVDRGLDEPELDLPKTETVVKRVKRLEDIAFDIDRLGDEVDVVRTELERFFRSLDALPEQLVVGFNPDYGPAWARAYYVAGTALTAIDSTKDDDMLEDDLKDRIWVQEAAIPHVLAMFPDEEVNSLCIGPDGTYPASPPTLRRRLRKTKAPRTGDALIREDGERIRREQRELSARMGEGDQGVSHARAAAGLSADNPAGNRVVIANISNLPGKRGSAEKGVLLLVRPLSPDDMHGYLFREDRSDFIDISNTPVVAEIFAGLNGPLIDPPLPGRVPTSPSSFTYSRSSKAVIGEALGQAIATGAFDQCPVMRSHNRGNLRNRLIPRCNAAAEEAMLQGVGPMIRAYRTGKGALIESWVATGSSRPPVARLWGDDDATETATTVHQFSRSYLNALAARHPMAVDNARGRGAVEIRPDTPVIELRAIFDPGPESLSHLVTVDSTVLKAATPDNGRQALRKKLPAVFRRHDVAPPTHLRVRHPARWRT